MSIEISASAETLMRQAGLTADEYMKSGIKHIDATFGDGFAKANPALLAAFMQTAAIDYHSAATIVAGQKVEEQLASIAEHLNDLSNQLPSAMGHVD